MDGVIYVAYGRKYVDEARRSAQSLHRFCDLPVCIISGDHVSGFNYSVACRLPPNLQPLLSKPYALASVELPFERFVLMDADTLVLADISPLFGLLERFDLAAVHCHRRNSGPGARTLPLGYVHFTTGVIVMKYDRAFLLDWARRAVENVDKYGNNDQPSFTEALYESNLSFYVLPTEFNTRIASKVYVSGKVYVIHGRNKRMLAARDSINNDLAPRIWIGKSGSSMVGLE
jgi:hypothetical protein